LSLLIVQAACAKNAGNLSIPAPDIQRAMILHQVPGLPDFPSTFFRPELP